MCGGTAWQVLALGAAPWNLTIIVPEVVLIEAAGNYQRSVADAMEGIDKWSVRHSSRIGGTHFTRATRDTLEEAASSYPDRLRDVLLDLKVEIAPPPEVPHRTIVERAARRRRPCDNNGDGYRDTLNWLTLLQLVRDRTHEDLVWVSNNTNDFGDEAASFKLHPDLLAELTAAGAEDRVRWVPDLSALILDLVAKHSSQPAADLATAADHLQDQTLAEFVSTEITPRIPGTILIPSRCGLPIDTRSAAIVTIGPQQNLVFSVRGEVINGETVAEFTFEAETAIELMRPTTSSPDDPLNTPTQIVKRLRFSGIVTRDRRSRPQSAELGHVEAVPHDLGLLPWERLSEQRAQAPSLRSYLPPDFFKSLSGLAAANNAVTANVSWANDFKKFSGNMNYDIIKSLSGFAAASNAVTANIAWANDLTKLYGIASPDYFKNILGIASPDYFKTLLELGIPLNVAADELGGTAVHQEAEGKADEPTESDDEDC